MSAPLVAVVDDDARIRELLRRYLGQEGFEVLAAEDARFYQHGGVDYKGVARAALGNLRDARSQGASTITMQVARNFYLSTEKTFTRKLYEVLLAFKIEPLLTKDQILDLYLLHAPYGGNIEGLRAASRAWFGKDPRRLTPAEAALLVAEGKAGFADARAARYRRVSELPFTSDRMRMATVFGIRGGDL